MGWRETCTLASVPNPPRLRVIAGLPAERVTSPGGYSLSGGVVLLIAEDGTGRLLDLAGEACALNVSATAIVECALGADIDKTCSGVAARFKVETGQVRSDIETLLSGLVRRGMMTSQAHTSRRCFGAPAVQRTIAPALAVCALAPHRALTVKAWVLLAVAFFAIRLFGWPRTAEAWLQAAAHRRTDAGHDDGAAITSIERAVASAIACYPVEVSCKERALCCHLLAGAAGIASRVVLGVDLNPFALHCWCECGSRILAERDDGLRNRFIPFMAYS